jgi:hypothetical protein
MTRAEIERRLNIHILNLALAGATVGATKKEDNIRTAKELLLDQVQEIVAETKAATLRTVVSVRGVA